MSASAPAKNLLALDTIGDRGRALQRPFAGYIELIARSNFSFLQGASHPEEMVEQSILYDYQGVGICDVNGLYGVVRGYQTVNQPSHFVASVHARKDFRYLVSSELTLTDGFSLILTPMNMRGYSQLCGLLTLGKRQAEKGFSKLSFEDVRKNSEDCLVYLLPPWEPEIFEKCERAFGDRLYLPVWKDLSWESLAFYRQALDLERERGAKLFATQRPFMHHRSRKPAFDVLTCLLHKTRLQEASPWLAGNGERCLRPLNELRFLWAERQDLLEKTLQIAARVTFSLSEIRYRYPNSGLPEGMSSHDYLRFLTEEGLKWRFPDGVQEKERQMVEHELAVIRDLQYEDYFLTLREICDFARSRGILYQGRGSAANSIVCYALGLTAVGPDKITLLFERFISRERAEPPDIDIDFEHERREEVIQHIYQKYGARHAAMVCNVVRLRSRSAFRETARVFGLSTAKIGEVVQYMGRDGFARLNEGPEDAARFGLDPLLWRNLLRAAREIKGFPRHLSIHSGGFVITHGPLSDLVPVEKATMEGRFVVQWNKDDVNTLGLMKIDLLSLGMLTCLRKSLDMLMQHKNLPLTLASLPADDEATYQMICRAETVGVFQIESRAQMQMLPRMAPKNFYDLVIEVAIVRPGPLQGGMVHPYLRRRQGLEKPSYPHRDLEKVLKRTCGVPIFQEQVMQIAVEGAGFTPGEADELRRIMSAAWRRQGVMTGVRDKILAGLRKKGMQEEYAEQVYRTIEGFASYGFPESHAASFALLTYASCYLKCHHPDVFACALLNSQPMGFYSPRTIIAEARKNGVEMRDIDINRSNHECTLEQSEHRLKPMRMGFGRMHGFAKDWSDKICRAREQGGGFNSLRDLAVRASLPKAALARLAAVGALREWGVEPRELLWQIEALELNPGDLFFAVEGTDEETGFLPRENVWEEMSREYAQQGLSLRHHPMSVLRPWLQKREQAGERKFDSAKDLEARRDREIVKVAGLVGLTQRPPTAKGFCFITLEDEFGFINVVIPPSVYQRDRMTIYTKRLLEIRGTLEKHGGVTNLKADSLRPLLNEEVKEPVRAARAGFSRSN